MRRVCARTPGVVKGVCSLKATVPSRPMHADVRISEITSSTHTRARTHTHTRTHTRTHTHTHTHAHAAGMRPVYYDLEDYPHEPQAGQQPIGHIPEVNHTYARYSCTYGILNEKQVGIGETTCSAIFHAKAAGHGGKAMMSVDALSRIGLERCATARCAVQTMGDLAVQYGFYGAGSFEGSVSGMKAVHGLSLGYVRRRKEETYSSATSL